MTRHESFRILLEEMCCHYGVAVPEGFTGGETVQVYRDDEGWHVGLPDDPCDDGTGVENLTDDEWAPKHQEHIETFRKIGF